MPNLRPYHCILGLALVLLSCSGEGPPGSDDPSPTADPLTIDQDGDGFSPLEGDCDDLDRDISPAAPEYCDGADNNCDGVIDEGSALDSQTYYADQDGDGYGDPTFSQRSCDIPDRFVSNNLDCNDATVEDRPGADEQCDIRDNDCDGLFDEGTPVDSLTFYLDEDGDGYGQDDVTTEACDLPPGYGVKGEDCDDEEPRSFPNNPEVCDGVDNNCDGDVDGPGAQNPPTWYQDVDGDGYGQDGTELTLCSAPFDYVLEGGDCDEEDTAINPGADERCDGIDNNCDDSVDGPESVDARAFFLDSDGDGFGDPATFVEACQAPEGYAPPNTDCDDTDPDINPGAPEFCTEEGAQAQDEDCDGAIDEDDADNALPHYPDGDGDGFGGQAQEAFACQVPEGRLLIGGDCDDTDSAINPAALELCVEPGGGPQRDNDCDGLIDEDDADDAMLLWPDADGDTYGADSTPTSSCTIAQGQSDRSGDCDDTNPDTRPGVEEICGDGIDNNCDGSPGECTLRHRAPSTLGGADVKIVGTQEGSFLGEDVAMVGDVNGDGYGDVLVGAWSYDVPGIGPDAGAAFLFYGPISPRTRQGRVFDREADVIFYGDLGGDHAGTAVAAAGDVNGDGFADILIGSNLAQLDNTYQGATYLFYGPLDPGTITMGSADAVIYGDEALDFAGTFLAAAGDLNNDGMGDILIGAPGVDIGLANDAGAAFILYGPIPKGVYKAGDLGTRLTGTVRGDNAGHGVAGGRDLSGDGRPDIAIGAPYSGDGGEKAGKVYVLYSPLPMVRELSLQDQATAIYIGENLGQGQAGYTLAMAGDLQGDGLDDLLIGAPRTDTSGHTNNGTAYIIHGPTTGHRTLESPPDTLFDGNQSDDQAAISVLGPGDLDLDGIGDLMVGAWGSDLPGSDGGAIALFFGPLQISGALSQAPAIILGEAPGDQAGVALDGGGDINGDGNPDIIVGALGQSESAPFAGAAYLILGSGY